MTIRRSSRDVCEAIVRESESAATRAVGLAARAHNYGRATTPAAAAAMKAAGGGSVAANKNDDKPADAALSYKKPVKSQGKAGQQKGKTAQPERNQLPESAWCKEGTCITFQREGKPCYRAPWFAGPLPKGKRDNPQIFERIARAKDENAKRLGRQNVPLLTSTPNQQPVGVSNVVEVEGALDGLDHFRLPVGVVAYAIEDATPKADMEAESPYAPQTNR